MADEWNKQNPDRPINLTVTTGESSSLHSKLLIACQSGEGAPDMADIENRTLWCILKRWLLTSNQ